MYSLGSRRRQRIRRTGLLGSLNLKTSEFWLRLGACPEGFTVLANLATRIERFRPENAATQISLANDVPESQYFFNRFRMNML